MILKRIYAALLVLIRRRHRSDRMEVLAAIAAIAGLIMAILKYFPAKSVEEKKARQRVHDVDKIMAQGEKFKKDRDTTHLGDID